MNSNFAIDTAGISAIVKLAVDIVKLIKPDAPSSVIVTVGGILSMLLSGLSVFQQTSIVDATSIYAIITQSLIVFGVAVGLTEVQKRAESKRAEMGSPERKIG